MVFNTNYNNMSVTSWRSVLLLKETGVPGKKDLYDMSNLQLLLKLMFSPLVIGNFPDDVYCRNTLCVRN
jgi:hypothetical protein